MATIGNTVPTLLDVSKQFTQDGKPLPIAELLAQTNEILDDIPWYEANEISGHRLAARAGYPTPTWRKLNSGVQPTKSVFTDVNESMGQLAELGECDRQMAELSSNKEQFRLNQNIGHIEAMNQGFVQALFYGDTDVNPEQFLGLSPRFDDITGPLNAEQIIDAGGTGSDNASIWLIGWGQMGAYGIYPKGSQAGLKHEDFGEELLVDANGGKYPGLRDWFQWNCGIAVHDWRNIVRVANIDVSELTNSGATGAKLIELMTAAVEQLDNRNIVNPAFYVPRKLRGILRQQIVNKSNVWLSMSEVAGRKVVAFDDIPVRRVDKLLLTEARIV